MRQRQLLKIQKQRHMSNIFIMLLNNPLFKNLSDRDQRKMARLIYKAEMIEMHARDRQLTRTNQSFQNIIDAINMAIDNDQIRYLEDEEEDDEDPFK